MADLTSVEICAGAGGQALGLEQAGFAHEAAVEIDADACETLRLNRGAAWKIVEGDVRELDGSGYRGVDLLAGGVPCPPFSIAGKQLGDGDDRDLFPHALRLAAEIEPRAVLLENVRGLAARRFDGYRAQVLARLAALGYRAWWQLINASDHGVPQLRPRFVLVALREPWARAFAWPAPDGSRGPAGVAGIAGPIGSAEAGPASGAGAGGAADAGGQEANPRRGGMPAAGAPTVGEALRDLMAEGGWPGAGAWAARANGIAPTLVGGSKKHGGPDLGPTRARLAWRALGVDGLGVADAAPGPGFPAAGLPKLTVRMAARLQGFPDDWQFAGRKTAAYRQVGNAFPPPVARALAIAIARALGLS